MDKKDNGNNKDNGRLTENKEVLKVFVDCLRALYPLGRKVYIKPRKCFGSVIAEAFINGDDKISLGVCSKNNEIIILSHLELATYTGLLATLKGIDQD